MRLDNLSESQNVDDRMVSPEAAAAFLWEAAEVNLASA